jgi:RimJ/RimL family protein N-acetyltransferase
MIDLERLHKRKLPLSYGTERLRLVLGDSRYTQQVVELRNDPNLNEWIHHDPLTPQAHDQFLDRELDRCDALNFAILIERKFAGIGGLYDIEGTTAEYGRLVLRDEGRVRRHSVVVTTLFLSFGFEVLGRDLIYCRMLDRNALVLGYAQKMGWKPEPRYDREVDFHGEHMKQLGYSVSASDWPAFFEAHRELLSEIVPD